MKLIGLEDMGALHGVWYEMGIYYNGKRHVYIVAPQSDMPQLHTSISLDNFASLVSVRLRIHDPVIPYIVVHGDAVARESLIYIPCCSEAAAYPGGTAARCRC